MGDHPRVGAARHIAWLLVAVAITGSVTAAAAVAASRGTAARAPSIRGVEVTVHNQSGRALALQRGKLINEPRIGTHLIIQGRRELLTGQSYTTQEHLDTLLQEQNVFIGLAGCGDFEFYNPSIFWPGFRLGTITHTGHVHLVKFSVSVTKTFSEDNAYSFTWNQHSYTVRRLHDSTNYKRFDLFVKSC